MPVFKFQPRGRMSHKETTSQPGIIRRMMRRASSGKPSQPSQPAPLEESSPGKQPAMVKDGETDEAPPAGEPPVGAPKPKPLATHSRRASMLDRFHCPPKRTSTSEDGGRPPESYVPRNAAHAFSRTSMSHVDRKGQRQSVPLIQQHFPSATLQLEFEQPTPVDGSDASEKAPRSPDQLHTDQRDKLEIQPAASPPHERDARGHSASDSPEPDQKADDEEPSDFQIFMQKAIAEDRGMILAHPRRKTTVINHPDFGGGMPAELHGSGDSGGVDTPAKRSGTSKRASWIRSKNSRDLTREKRRSNVDLAFPSHKGRASVSRRRSSVSHKIADYIKPVERPPVVYEQPGY